MSSSLIQTQAVDLVFICCPVNVYILKRTVCLHLHHDKSYGMLFQLHERLEVSMQLGETYVCIYQHQDLAT